MTALTLVITASPKAGLVQLILENRGASALDVLSHVVAGGRIDLDWYTVIVDVGGAARELHFIGARDHAARVRKTIAPGASLAHDVDLDWWARQDGNGRQPLPRGAGTLVATYEVIGEPGVWCGRVESAPLAMTF